MATTGVTAAAADGASPHASTSTTTRVGPSSQTAAPLGAYKPCWQALAGRTFNDGSVLANQVDKEVCVNTRRMAVAWTGDSSRPLRPPTAADVAAAAVQQQPPMGALSSPARAAQQLLRANMDKLMREARLDREEWALTTEDEVSEAEELLQLPEAEGLAGAAARLWRLQQQPPSSRAHMAMLQTLLLESADSILSLSAEHAAAAFAVTEAPHRKLLLAAVADMQAGGGSGLNHVSASWRLLAHLLPAWTAPGQTTELWAWLLETAAGAADEAWRPQGAGPDSSSSNAHVTEAVHLVLRGAACFLALLLGTRASGLNKVAAQGGLVWVPPIVGSLEDVRSLRALDPLAMAVAWPAWLLARAQHQAQVTPMQLYRTLLLGQLPAVAPPPPPLSYGHCLAVIESFARDAAVIATWTDALLDATEESIPICIQVITDLQLQRWQAAWDAARRDGIADVGGRAGDEGADADVEYSAYDEEAAIGEEGCAQGSIELRPHQQACLANAWLCDDLEQLLSPHVGLVTIAGVCMAGGEKAAAAAARAAARRLGVEGVLEEAAALRPPAAAIVTALRALPLLRLPVGLVAPLAYLSAGDGKLAVAGVVACRQQQGEAGGCCDVLRLRVSSETASLAAMVMLLRCRKLSQCSEVSESGCRFVFQPNLPLPQAAAAAAAGGRRSGGTSVAEQHQAEGHEAAAAMTTLEVCRSFVPSFSCRSGKRLWPYPVLSINAYGTHLWDDTTTQRDMVWALRRALVDRGMGMCVAFVCGPETVCRAMAALAQFRAEMLENGRDVAACHGETVLYCGDASKAVASSGKPVQGRPCQQRKEPRRVPRKAAAADSDDEDGSSSSDEGKEEEDEEEEHQRGPIKRPFLAVDSVVNLLPQLAGDALVLSRERLSPSAGPVAAGGSGGTAAAAAGAGKKERQQQPAGLRASQKQKQQPRTEAAVREEKTSGGGASAAAAAAEQQQQQQQKVVAEAVAAGLSEGCDAYLRLLRDAEDLVETHRALEVEMQVGAMLQQLRQEQQRLDSQAAARQQSPAGGQRQQQQQQGHQGRRQARPGESRLRLGEGLYALDDRMSLEMRFLEVTPGRPWELVVPAPERVRELEDKLGRETYGKLLLGR